jgi:hypothetical protein
VDVSHLAKSESLTGLRLLFLIPLPTRNSIMAEVSQWQIEKDSSSTHQDQDATSAIRYPFPIPTILDNLVMHLINSIRAPQIYQ